MLRHVRDAFPQGTATRIPTGQGSVRVRIAIQRGAVPVRQDQDVGELRAGRGSRPRLRDGSVRVAAADEEDTESHQAPATGRCQGDGRAAKANVGQPQCAAHCRSRASTAEGVECKWHFMVCSCYCYFFSLSFLPIFLLYSIFFYFLLLVFTFYYQFYSIDCTKPKAFLSLFLYWDYDMLANMDGLSQRSLYHAPLVYALG